MHASAIQADNVIVMILNPDASFEGSHFRFVPGFNINGEAPNVTKILPTNGFECIVGAVKVSIVHHQGLYCEAVHMEVGSQNLTFTLEPVEGSIRDEGNLLHRRGKGSPAPQATVA